MQDTPVYLVTGFLESGKTKFIQETLQGSSSKPGSRLSAVGNAEAGLQLEGQVLEPSAWGWIPALVAQR